LLRNVLKTKKARLMLQFHSGIHCNQFLQRRLPQYSNSICIKLPFATNSTFELAEYAVMGLEQIFKKGYAYKRAGVLVMDFTPESNQQLNLFQNRNVKHIPIMHAMDN